MVTIQFYFIITIVRVIFLSLFCTSTLSFLLEVKLAKISNKPMVSKQTIGYSFGLTWVMNVCVMSHGQWWWVVECSGGKGHRKTIGDVLWGLGLCSYQKSWGYETFSHKSICIAIPYFSMDYHQVWLYLTFAENGLHKHEIWQGFTWP